MSNSKNIAIRITDLSKRYFIGRKKDTSLRGTLSSILKTGNASDEEFWALRDINLDIEKGDVIGIIGKNGAGKSTLLKVLSQITRPTTGRIEINGRVASLLEVGTGFHPELTGRENIFLNGTILGMTRKEVQSKFDEIVAFSGIEKFIDTPVKRYSSGMYVRLAFAVAAHLEPEILIIDEVLAVGDIEFQKKCLGKMKDVAGEGRTVIFVSHDLGAVKALCKKGVFISKGEIAFAGTIEKTIEAYQSKSNNNAYYKPNLIRSENAVFYKSISVKDSLKKLNSEFKVNEKISIAFEFGINELEHPYSIFVIIKSIQGTHVFSAEHNIDKEYFTLEIEANFLTRGKYSIYSFIHNPRIIDIERAEDVCQFEVFDNSSKFADYGGYDYGYVFGNYKWLD